MEMTKDEAKAQLEEYYIELDDALSYEFEMGYLTRKEFLYKQKQNDRRYKYDLEDLERYFSGRPSQAREKAIKDQQAWDELVKATDESYARWLEIEQELGKI